MTIDLDVFSATDVGKLRKRNEDAYVVDSKLGIFAVAEGMGGHAGGEVASRTAVTTAHEALAAKLKGARLSDQECSPSVRSEIAAMVREAIQAACARIHAITSLRSKVTQNMRSAS